MTVHVNDDPFVGSVHFPTPKPQTAPPRAAVVLATCHSLGGQKQSDQSGHQGKGVLAHNAKFGSRK